MRYFLWRFVGVGDDGLVPMNVGLVKNVPATEILSVVSVGSGGIALVLSGVGIDGEHADQRDAFCSFW